MNHERGKHMCSMPRERLNDSLDEQEAAAEVVSQPKGYIRRKVIAEAHNDCCNQSILLAPLKATKAEAFKGRASAQHTCAKHSHHIDMVMESWEEDWRVPRATGKAEAHRK